MKTETTMAFLFGMLLTIALCAGSATQVAATPQDIYLVITEDSLREDIEPLADWRYQQGYDVKVINLSEIPSSGANATSEDIRDYIKSVSPTYLLLVGNVPASSFVVGEKVFATDFNYSRIDSDLFPDIFVGRLPADSIIIVVDKILDYEKNPDMSSDWRNKVLLTEPFWMRMVPEYNGDGTPWNRTVYKDFESIRDGVGTGGGLEGLGYDCEIIYVMDPEERDEILSTPRPWYYSRGSGLEEREKMNPSIDVNGTTQDVMDSIGEGASIVQYSGHGNIFGWCLTPPIYNSDIINMNNGNKLPLFVSICCNSGYFDHPSVDCFAEELIKEENGGAIGVVAACNTAGTSDEFYFEIYNSILNLEPDRPSSIEPIRGELGRVLVSAKTRLLSMRESVWIHNLPGDITQPVETRLLKVEEDSTIRALAEPVWAYNLIGDPALALQTKVPQEINVSTDVNLESGNVTFEVTMLAGGEINDSLVCLMGDDLHVSGRTENGSIVFPAMFSSSEISVTITGWNLLPYENAITPAIRGDVNQDRELTMEDVDIVLDLVFGGGNYIAVADMDNNGRLSILDIRMLTRIIAEGN